MRQALITGLLVVCSIAHFSSDTFAQEPANNATITLSGKVASIASGDEFILDYGDGTIKVDTNDAWPNIFKRDAYRVDEILQEGERVWVSGKIDHNWFSSNELDAYTLWQTENGRTIVYKSLPSNKETEFPDGGVLPEEGTAIVTGTISKVVGSHDYLLQYGSSPNDTIQVDVSHIGGIEANAYQVGDRVTVSGRMDQRLLSRREIDASYIKRVDQARGGVRS